MKKAMTKRLTRLGNSAALVIDKPILELLRIGLETPLEISTDGVSLTVTPVRTPTREQLDKTLDRVIKKYGKAFERLGDPTSSSTSSKSIKSTRD